MKPAEMRAGLRLVDSLLNETICPNGFSTF